MKKKVLNLSEHRRQKSSRESFTRGRKSLLEKDNSLSDLLKLQEQVRDLKSYLLRIKNLRPPGDGYLH